MFHDPIAAEKFGNLQKEFGFKVCVETGTHFGHGAMNASKYCPTVYTFEVHKHHQDKAVEEWIKDGFEITVDYERIVARKELAVIYSYLISSQDGLKKVIPTITKKICFYLDAHWGAYWPLLDELKEISRWSIKSDCVIIIHDFKVPGKPWAFDNHNGHDLDINYVKPSLDRINPTFTISYNEEAAGDQRGILYATP